MNVLSDIIISPEQCEALNVEEGTSAMQSTPRRTQKDLNILRGLHEGSGISPFESQIGDSDERLFGEVETSDVGSIGDYVKTIIVTITKKCKEMRKKIDKCQQERRVLRKRDKVLAGRIEKLEKKMKLDKKVISLVSLHKDGSLDLSSNGDCEYPEHCEVLEVKGAAEGLFSEVENSDRGTL